MQLYVTYGSPYARLARIVVVEKGLEDRVEIIEAKTRMKDSPYYQISPSGRVPYLVDDTGAGMEDSRLICAYLDSLDGKPRLHDPLLENDWAYRRLEASARSMCEDICVWVRQMHLPECERSPTVLAHEVARSQRMASFFEERVPDPPLQGAPRMAHLIPGGLCRYRAQEGPRRSHRWPTATRHLGEPHFRSARNASNSLALIAVPLWKKGPPQPRQLSRARAYSLHPSFCSTCVIWAMRLRTLRDNGSAAGLLKLQSGQRVRAKGSVNWSQYRWG